MTFWIHDSRRICEDVDCEKPADSIVRSVMHVYGHLCRRHAEIRLAELQAEHAEVTRGIEMIQSAEAEVDPQGLLVGRSLTRAAAKLIRLKAARAPHPAREQMEKIADAMEALHA